MNGSLIDLHISIHALLRITLDRYHKESAFCEIAWDRIAHTVYGTVVEL